MITGVYTEYYFDIEETSSAIHFIFKSNLKNDIEKRKCLIGYELVKSWLIENIGDGVHEDLFGDRKQIVLNPDACSLFEELKEEFESYKNTIYLESLTNLRAVSKIIEKSVIINEKKKIKELYLNMVFGREKDFQGASELLVKYILKYNTIYTTKVDKESEMWIFKDGIYIPNGKSEIREITRDILQELLSNHTLNLIILKIEADTYIEFDKFFKTNYKELVPVENGILNVLTRELKPFDKKYIFFAKLPVKFDPLMKCEQIDLFLSEVLAKPSDKEVFYEIAGFSLYKEYTFEKGFMFIGGGRNGKGKSIELIKRMIGLDNIASLSLASLHPESFSISTLFGKMINLAGDIGYQDLKDTSVYKSLTGRDLFGAKRKFLNNLTFENYAKFIFACNELPMVYDNSKGFWDRWVLLEYPYTFVTKEEYEQSFTNSSIKLRDEDKINKIATPEELSGLLNKSLDGLDRLLKNRNFSTTLGSEEVKVKWIRKSNSFMAFCLDNIEDDYDSIITKKDLRKNYAEYCKEHKIMPKSDFVIKKALSENYGATESKRELLGEWEYVWIGVKLKEKKAFLGHIGFLENSIESHAPLGSEKKVYVLEMEGNYKNNCMNNINQYIKMYINKEFYISDFIDFGKSETEIKEFLSILVEKGELIEVKNNCWKAVK